MDAPALRDEDPDRLVTTEWVAEACGVTKRTVEDWRRRSGYGPPPIYLTLRTVRYRLGDILAWLDRRRR